MRAIWVKRAAGLLAGSVLLAGAVWMAWPRPVPVDLVAVGRGPMEVTVAEEARTRVRHIYTVSAPIAGKALRISPPRHVGEEVVADDTIVAVMQPTIPSFHDARTHQELEAALTAAEAAVQLAEAEVRRIEAALSFSRSELQRTAALARTEAAPLRALDKAKLDVETNEAGLASAKAQLEVRRSERASVAARVREPSGDIGQPSGSCCIQLRAPVTGRILRIVQESEGVVQAGAPLVEIGSPSDLELVADLLSADAVRVKPGAAVRIDGWGGDPLNGRVVRVDPAGFMKVSALGIEEQRVRTVIDFTDPPAAWSSLGHDFRAIVHVRIWAADDALTLPTGSLFRQGDQWAVYSVSNGRALSRVVAVGQRNNRSAQIQGGLAAGDMVILHPSDRISEGVRVVPRGR